MKTRPRLESLVVSNFRSIAGTWTVPLDGSIVLIHGDNGAGKTSLLSAIELAATGDVSYLQSAGNKSYQNHLVHRRSSEGFVELQSQTLGVGPSRAGRFAFSGSGASGKAMLAKEQARHFSERCMLSQVTLGRLLDVYAPQDQKQQVSSLIGFVKELLGLDVLDALIDGLKSTTRMDITRRKSHLWTGSHEARTEAERKLETLRAGLTELRQEAKSNFNDLLDVAQRSGLSVAAEPESAMKSIRHHLRSSEEHQSLFTAVLEQSARLEATHVLLDALHAAATESGGSSIDDLDLRISSAKADLSDWWKTEGLVVSSFFRACMEFLRQPAAWDEEQATALCSRAQIQLRDERASLEDALAKSNAAQATLNSQRQRLAEVTEKSVSLRASRDLLGVNILSGQISQVLSQTLEALQTDTCPVCDQGYPGGQNDLRRHIESKLESLDGKAREWAALDSAISDCVNEITHLSGEVERQEQRVADASEIKESKDRLKRASELIRAGSRMAGLLQSAAPLEESVQAAMSMRAAAIDRVSLSNQVERMLTTIASRLGFNDSDAVSESFGKRVQALEEHAFNERKRLEALLERENQVKTLMDRHVKSKERLDDATTELKVEENKLSALTIQLTEAERRKDIAFDLRKSAEVIRSEVINAVFDQQLNRTWKELFSRLVPGEPFVPQFEKQFKRDRSASVNLTTIDREGEGAGTPSAMLSYGNVNTAALSLFLSLHFVAKNELPWLILDDPVQSMDDIHIANFAALLKHIVREEGRQVVIAVHQRELFDYLALELSPAREGEELIAVEVQRDRDETRIETQRYSYVVDTALGTSVA